MEDQIKFHKDGGAFTELINKIYTGILHWKALHFSSNDLPFLIAAALV